MGHSECHRSCMASKTHAPYAFCIAEAALMSSVSLSTQDISSRLIKNPVTKRSRICHFVGSTRVQDPSEAVDAGQFVALFPDGVDRSDPSEERAINSSKPCELIGMLRALSDGVHPLRTRLR